MENIKNHFDDFNFHARVMPMLVLLLPVISIFVLKGFLNETIFNNSIYLFMILIFITLAAKIGREKGKAYEKKMYNKLGGLPTTIMLRFSDNRLDYMTKVRYHNKLSNIIDNLNLPIDESFENSNSDIIYDSAINWLRNYANSNRESEPRVYQELKEYNFWRNLYGAKPFALVLYLLIALRELALIEDFNILDLLMKPFPSYLAFIITLISMFSIVVFVNKNVVDNKAFDYARTLLEVSERL